MKKRLLYVGALLTTVLVNAQQQDSIKVEKLQEVVVTATKIPTERKNLGKIVYQITPAMIKRNQGKSVVDLLNDVPGVEINGNYSTKGQNLGYYLRGGRNRQVAILIDGIVVNDPSSFNNDFDLRQLPIEQVESIEILKGAASTLYGTGAATGVINIILKKATKEAFSGSFSTYIGTNNSQEDQDSQLDDLGVGFNFNGTLEKFNYLIGLNGTRSAGLSAAESTDDNKPFQEDSFNRINSLLKLGFQVNKRLNLGAFASYDEYSTDFDGFDFVTNGFIDADNSLQSMQKRAGLTANYKYKKGFLRVNTSYTHIDRTVQPSADVFEGEAYGFDLYNNYEFSKNVSLLTGLAAQAQDMFQSTAFSSIEEGSAKQHFYDPYISLNFKNASGLNINAGGRLNLHNAYGSHLVYNINPSYNLFISKESSLKLLASYSTAFITPTLQEIFNKLPTIAELNPEKDVTIEAGFDWIVSKKFDFNTVFFYREETDKIGFDFTTFQTINDIGTFTARGFETSANYKASEHLNLSLNYAYINRKESLLLKIPKHKFGLSLDYQISNSTQVAFNGKFVDATSDFGGVALPSYRIIDFFLNHRLVKNRITAFAAVSNFLNENYQEIAGFSTRGRNYKIGLRVYF